MNAIVFNGLAEYPEYLPIDIEKSGKIEVTLSSSALNHRDLWITKGMYARLKPGSIMGSDGVGTANGERWIINPSVNWGSNEKVQSINFSVLGMPTHGTFAPYFYADKNQLVKCPVYLTDFEAAALPLAGLTAFRAITVKCNLQPGDKVLITGIGGGVALIAAQFAIALGCDVFATSGDDQKLTKAKKVGVIDGVNYKNEDWDKDLIKKADGGFDVIIDSAGGKDFHLLTKLANPGGRIAFYGGTSGNIDKLNPQLIFWKQLSIFGSTMGSNTDFSNMLKFVEKYTIRPIIDEVIPLKDYKKAFDKLKNHSQFGKVVLNNQIF